MHLVDMIKQTKVKAQNVRIKQNKTKKNCDQSTEKNTIYALVSLIAISKKVNKKNLKKNQIELKRK